MVNGNPVYLYADPLDCNCVYFGTQQNWDAYKQEIFAKQLADEAQMTAIMTQGIGTETPGAGRDGCRLSAREPEPRALIDGHMTTPYRCPSAPLAPRGPGPAIWQFAIGLESENNGRKWEFPPSHTHAICRRSKDGIWNIRRLRRSVDRGTLA